MKTHPILKIINGSFVDLPSPKNISTWWNFGSLLGLTLIIQLVTGLLLAMQYNGGVTTAFARVDRLSRDVFSGWLLRTSHANGARFFFFCLYFHIGRGIYYGSYFLHITWRVGVIILLATIAAAFFGYVLPWGQISIWGASVITRLFSAIPYIGEDFVQWLWGGFAVNNATLTRFFAFHFLVPFIVIALVIIHLLFLHQTGSNNPLGLSSRYNKIPFNPYFLYKDLFGALCLLMLLLRLVVRAPWLLGDPENFIAANSLVTPVHIQPEWYFLFAYAILRSIPNKLGGVIGLAISIIILLVLPFQKTSNFQRTSFYPLRIILFWTFINIILLLTWIGARSVEEPYIITGQCLTLLYFRYFRIHVYLKNKWDSLLRN